MVDFTMCIGGNCPLKRGCLRYRAVPAFRQMYFTDPPYRDESCQAYKKIFEDDKIKSVDEIIDIPVKIEDEDSPF